MAEPPPPQEGRDGDAVAVPTFRELRECLAPAGPDVEINLAATNGCLLCQWLSATHGLPPVWDDDVYRWYVGADGDARRCRPDSYRGDGPVVARLPSPLREDARDWFLSTETGTRPIEAKDLIEVLRLYETDPTAARARLHTLMGGGVSHGAGAP